VCTAVRAQERDIDTAACRKYIGACSQAPMGGNRMQVSTTHFLTGCLALFAKHAHWWHKPGLIFDRTSYELRLTTNNCDNCDNYFNSC